MKGRTLLLLAVWLFLVVAGTLFVLRAVEKRAAMERQVSEARQRAEEAVAALQERLKSELTAAMQQGGPAAALRVCAESAQPLTEDFRGEAGFPVGRTALRLRNPANAPGPLAEEWMRRVGVQTSAAAPVEPAVKVEEFLDGDRLLHYWQPIYVQPQCLPCHGMPEQIPAEVADLLAERYPEDRATGFAAGDFRGIFWAQVPLPKIEG
ncbi:MAG: DUF3365 domain-containing protein [Planctomycetota bacterium]|nr:MAG: DUF3365 domain-containing protein [Planctomycetota bacterium]